MIHRGVYFLITPGISEHQSPQILRGFMSSKRKSFLISHRGNMDSLRSFVKLCSLALPIALISMTGFGSLAPTTKTTKSLISISITPSNPSIAINATEQFTATGNYNDGSTADLSSAATWASSNQANATMNGTGVATGIAAGNTTITASVSGVTGSTTLTVMAAAVTVTSIAVSPKAQTITAGATHQFTANQTKSTG